MATGGIGESMLLGAALGAGTSAVTGNDPLKGALMGGALGGIGPMFGGASEVGNAAANAGANIGTTAGGTALNAATDQGVAQLLGNTGAANAITNTAANTASNPSLWSQGANWISQGNRPLYALGGIGASKLMYDERERLKPPVQKPYTGILSKYDPYTAGGVQYPTMFAEGGIAALAPGGIAGTERGMYPQSQMDKVQYAVPSQMPTSAEVIASDYEPKVNPYTGQEQFASGGISSLGGYSDGGRMLKGPGDGMSDSIPASIGGKQPARLADGEFVVPADVVSHLGNGSTDAGAKHLYSMMDKVRKARTGTKKQGKKINPGKFVPV